MKWLQACLFTAVTMLFGCEKPCKPGFQRYGADCVRSPDGGMDAAAREGGSIGDAKISDREGGMQNDASSRVICEQEADQEAGTFVSLFGTDDASCGAKEAPCKTINRALTRAVARASSVVYVATGVYVDAVDLRPDLSISGGWDGEWKRDCEAPLRTTIQAPAGSDFAVQARDLRGRAVLEYLTLLGDDTASSDAGRSVFGLFATGDSTALELRSVDITVPGAGDGASAANGSPGANATGTCSPPSDGSPGRKGSDGEPGKGEFTDAGYEAGDGSSGTPGERGENGNRTVAVEDREINYLCASPCPAPTTKPLPKGTDGLPGCGGSGGASGLGGPGGGSSIALFVWDAEVRVVKGSLTAGKGGDGGDGGVGGEGGLPSDGENGLAGPAQTVSVNSCCGPIINASAKGGEGFGGGKGGRGGDGGGGAGGSSFAVFVGGVGKADIAQATLRFGRAGSPGGGPLPGAPGDAGAKNF